MDHSHSRRDFLQRAGAVAGITAVTAHAQPPAQRPNIVFICTDDQASWTLRCLGNAEAHTPNLDRFFAEGVTLTNSFVITPVCSPSRVSTMTSRYGTEAGITDWLNPREEPELGLAQDFLTWPELLVDAGYQTALVGKWHLGIQDRYHPSKQGFQIFTGFRGGGVPPVDPSFEVGGVETPQTGICDDRLTDYAIDHLKQFDRTRPFLLNLHYRWPHAPWQPLPESDWAPYKDLDPTIPNPDYPNLDVENVKKRMKEYLAACTGVDRNVGLVLGALDELGLSENTIVVFTSDNGYNMGHNGVWHKGNAHRITMDMRGIPGNDGRAARPNIYDNSIRVPTAIRWPGKLHAGQINNETVSNLDWFPTLLAMAGVAIPDGTLLRGKNALPILQGKRMAWDNDLYAEFSQHHYATADLRMYRTPEWKLVRDFKNAGKDELYDLAKDPAESRNLLDDPGAQAMRVELNEKLLAKMKELRDPVLDRS